MLTYTNFVDQGLGEIINNKSALASIMHALYVNAINLFAQNNSPSKMINLQLFSLCCNLPVDSNTFSIEQYARKFFQKARFIAQCIPSSAESIPMTGSCKQRKNLPQLNKMINAQNEVFTSSLNHIKPVIDCSRFAEKKLPISFKVLTKTFMGSESPNATIFNDKISRDLEMLSETIKPYRRDSLNKMLKSLFDSKSTQRHYPEGLSVNIERLYYCVTHFETFTIMGIAHLILERNIDDFLEANHSVFQRTSSGSGIIAVSQDAEENALSGVD